MYRFALIGQTSSGKTCYMATLALNVAHPDGLTSQLKRDLTGDRQATEAEPEGEDAAGGDSFVDDAAAERKGNDWILKAMRALSRGELPPPNDPDRYLVDFLIGSETRGMTEVRMVDYAGEFINQEIERTEDRAALFRHLQSCDGLLVVAEVIPDHISDAERKVVSDRIRKVADFFGSLHDSCKGHLGTAIAVVLSKWDQHSTIDFDRPDAENAKVRDYLRRSPQHQGLVAQVRNFLVEQVEVAVDLPVGIQFGNCAVFPASAFGRCLRDDGGYRPDVDARQPFGLIEPLLWLASRYEEIRTANIEDAWQRAIVARVWPLSAARLSKQAAALLESVPSKSTVARRLRTVRTAAVAAALTAATCWSLCGALGIDSLRYYWLRARWERQLAVVNDPAIDDETLVAARQFFKAQALTSWTGLLSYVAKPSIDATAANAEVERIDSRRVQHFNQLLDRALSSRDDAVILSAAKEYLDKLPSGPRRSDAETEKERVETNIARNRLRYLINDYRLTIDTCEDQPELVRIKNIAEGLRLQSRDGDATLEGAYRDFIEQITAREKILTVRVRQVQLKEAVDSALTNGDLTQAASALVTATTRDDFWEATVNRFVKQVPEQLENRIKSLVGGENFDTAATAAADAVTALRNLEAAVPADRSGVRKTVVDAIPVVAAIRRQSLDEPYDRYLYKEVVSAKNEANCTRYLNTAPVGGMKLAVQDYRDFLESSRKPTQITVTPCIRWGEINYDGTPSFAIKWTLSADGQPVAQKSDLRVANVAELPGQLQAGVAMQARGLDEAIAIKLEIVELDFFGDDDIGTFEQRITPREMLEPKSFFVTGSEVAKGKPHVLWFSDLHGYRREPSLPLWHP
jgi:hypothetical protein